MTSRGTWKSRERQVARTFGAERTPLSGGNSRISRSDSTHRELFIETKFKAKHSIIKLWDETKEKAAVENKVPIVCLCVKGRPKFWTIVHIDDLDTIVSAKLKANFLKGDVNNIMHENNDTDIKATETSREQSRQDD